MIGKWVEEYLKTAVDNIGAMTRGEKEIIRKHIIEFVKFASRREQENG